jgi:hypothetical protein
VIDLSVVGDALIRAVICNLAGSSLAAQSMGIDIKSDFSCLVDSESLIMSASQSITGRIAVRLAGHWFPEENWHDFPVRILGDWITKTRDLNCTGAKSCKLSFMEGPFQLLVTPIEDGCWRVVAQERRRTKLSNNYCCTVSPDEMLSEFDKAALTLCESPIREDIRNSPDLRFLISLV